jgi:hypothetical protein
MILLWHHGLPAIRIAELLGCDQRRCAGGHRYNTHGTGGLADRPRQPDRVHLGPA